GSLSRYKACLVANGNSQQLCVNYDDTFSPIVKLATIRTVLSLATSRNSLVHQLNVKNAFLHGTLSETASLSHVNGMFLSQKKHATDILERAGIRNCHLCRTSIDTESKLGADGTLVSDLTLNKNLAGALQYLTLTRVMQFSRFVTICMILGSLILHLLKRILRYVCGTSNYGLQLFSSSTSSLVAYSNVDWAGCLTTRHSFSYYVFLGKNLLSWSSKRQYTLPYSSVEAEYRGVANAVDETSWLQNLFREIHSPLH
ncbi:ribonuclease H-like domain-containing protein, partial [Tanacetum coccineum]